MVDVKVPLLWINARVSLDRPLAQWEDLGVLVQELTMTIWFSGFLHESDATPRVKGPYDVLEVDAVVGRCSHGFPNFRSLRERSAEEPFGAYLELPEVER